MNEWRKSKHTVVLFRRQTNRCSAIVGIDELCLCLSAKSKVDLNLLGLPLYQTLLKLKNGDIPVRIFCTRTPTLSLDFRRYGIETSGPYFLSIPKISLCFIYAMLCYVPQYFANSNGLFHKEIAPPPPVEDTNIFHTKPIFNLTLNLYIFKKIL